nr:hypothetical protein TorRG33x02_273240 [Ipomoea trifida]
MLAMVAKDCSLLLESPRMPTVGSLSELLSLSSFLKDAQIYDFLHRPFILFLLRERLAQESRQLLDVDDSVCLQILVPQEQHFVGELDAGFAVGGDVIPVGAERRDPARESVESLLERNGGEVFGGQLSYEVPERYQNVLGIAKHFLKDAQIYDFLHRPFILFLLRERLAQESRQLLDVDDSVCLQILVPQEQHFVGELDAGFVVGGDVIPVGAERRDPARESVESLLERNGGEVFGGQLSYEVPERYQNVLGIAKHALGWWGFQWRRHPNEGPNHEDLRRGLGWGCHMDGKEREYDEC